MGAVQIKYNSQRLILTAVKVHEDGSDITAYSDSTMLSSISLPLTITADYTLYVEDGSKTLTITQEDGTAYPVQRVEVEPGITKIVNVVPAFLDVLADLEALKGPTSGSLKSGTKIGAGSSIYSGSAAPSFSAAAGDFYFRTGATGAATTRIYINTASGNNWANALA